MSGQVFEPIDGIGYIGRDPRDRHIHIATGDSGNGMMHGTLAGLLIPDLILGRSSKWTTLYDPSRKTWSAAQEFLSENLNTFWQYKDLLNPGELQKIDKLPVNQGIILREGLQKLAVYKDPDHRVHVTSAFCPHLGACVSWNDLEKS